MDVIVRIGAPAPVASPRTAATSSPVIAGPRRDRDDVPSKVTPMTDERSTRAVANDAAFLSLVTKLEQLAETLPAHEQQLLRAWIDRRMDPLERLRRREGDAVLDDADIALLDQLEASR